MRSKKKSNPDQSCTAAPVRAARAGSRRVRAAAGKAGAATGALAGVRVLFVETMAANRRALTRLFAQQHARADGFGNPAQALAAMEAAVIADDPYRIAIVGQQMEGIDGETLGRAIMAEPRFGATSLVMLGAAGHAEVARFAEAGFSAFFNKPLAPQRLTGMLGALWTEIAKGAAPSFVTNVEMPASARAPVQPALRFSGYRILVADDNVVHQQVALRMLKNLGCSGAAATDGRQAVDMHRSQNYDLILMDCQMPGLDGFQATAMIRGNETEARRTPIIAWSAEAAPGGRERCLNAGMDDFIAKPIRQNVMHDMLERWLHPDGASVPAPTPDKDRDELEAIQEMFGADFPELVALFLTDSPKRITDLQQVAVERDTTAMARVAHALSGSTAAIGACGLSALCKDLELNSRAGRLADVDARMKSIEIEFARIEARLRAMAPAGIP